MDGRTESGSHFGIFGVNRTTDVFVYELYIVHWRPVRWEHQLTTHTGKTPKDGSTCSVSAAREHDSVCAMCILCANATHRRGRVWRIDGHRTPLVRRDFGKACVCPLSAMSRCDVRGWEGVQVETRNRAYRGRRRHTGRMCTVPPRASCREPRSRVAAMGESASMLGLHLLSLPLPLLGCPFLLVLRAVVLLEEPRLRIGW